MSKIGRRFVIPAILGTMAASASLAASAAASGYPAFSETQTGIRCHYTVKGDPTGATTAFVEADSKLRGYWHNASILPSRSLYFTDTTPAIVRAACAKKIATIPAAKELVMVGAATSAHSYNYEIWYNGDQAKDKPIERIVSFGDSLSDTGNMHNQSQWMLPGASWYMGRFSNGPTWVEYLARHAGVTLNNWAVGGAQTKDAHVGIIHGVGTQIDGFFQYMRKAKGYDPSRTLFTFLVSGNDFVNDTKTAPQIIADQEKALGKLVDGGARKILVLKLPDVSVAPVFTMKGGRTDAHTVLGKVDYYNSQIRDVAARVAARAKGTEIMVVESREYFNELLAKPANFGFTNTKDSCLQIDSPSSLGYVKTQKPRVGCTDPSKYVFWDTLHPTTRTHELMAAWAIDATPVHWGLRK